MLKKLSKYMKGLWGLAAISAAGMIVEAISELALPSLATAFIKKWTPPPRRRACVLR
mgnify:CR=1 FL=1